MKIIIILTVLFSGAETTNPNSKEKCIYSIWWGSDFLNICTILLTFVLILEKNNKTKNKTKQSRTEQNRTEQNRTEQNRTEQKRTKHEDQSLTPTLNITITGVCAGHMKAYR